MKKIICIVCVIAIVISFCLQSVFASEVANVSIEAYFEENKDTISGAAVIQIKNGGITGEYYYGLADIENNLAVDESTVFEWASITKLLTWTSVMQLVERGEIELDRDIREYLPEGFLTRLSYDKPITMLNLMHHNAGWADVMTFHYTPKAMDLGNALKKYEPRQLYEPGTVEAYSSYGTALAGYIVECVSGKQCWQYINENIFDLLDMENTTVHPTQSDRPDIATRRDKVKGYDESRKYISNHRVYDYLYPAGSAMGTMDDMAKFVMALMPPDGNDSPLFQKRETLELMLTPSLFFLENSPVIAHGFFIELRNGKYFYGHSGGAKGFTCNLLFAPDTHEALLVMTNTANEYVLCGGLAEKLLGILNLSSTVETGESMAGEGTAKKVTGVYMSAVRYVDTFINLGRFMSPIIVTAKDDTTIELFSIEYKQTEPYVFVSDDGYAVQFISKAGKVDMLAWPGSTFIKEPSELLVFECSLLGLLMLAAVYCIVTLCASGLRKLISKPVKSRLRVARNITCTFYLAIIANVFMCAQAAMSDPEYASLVSHFIVSALTLPAFVAYVWFFIKTDKKKYSKADVQLSVITGICFLIELISVVVFNLWR